MRCITGIILSHSCIAYTGVSDKSVIHAKNTHSCVEFDLSLGQIPQHLLHLCFFRELEDGLFAECLVAKGIGGFLRSRNRVLELGED
jgi:hypothetical protein